MSGPRVLVIRVGEACNAGCFMCEFAFSSDPYHFTAGDARALAEQLRGGTIRVVRFTGGEPLLLADLPEIVAAFSGEALTTSIITNGWHLAERAESLGRAGLGQIIASVDGASRESHDRFRRLDGLFDRIAEGISTLRRVAPHVTVRVNSVLGPHNLVELEDMYRVFSRWGVDQWSIIPLKRADRAWLKHTDQELLASIGRLRALTAIEPGPRLLGYSGDWAGRNADEVRVLREDERNMTPRGECGLVDLVRYYVPKDGIVFPCNCVPHRIGGQSFSEPAGKSSFTDRGLGAARDWLRVHGPESCMGCEPVNAALGEHAIDLDRDPLGY
jgi:cytosylglucuronate decarboxylase